MNKTALITGGNSGIGYATAKLLKEKDYSVTIAGRNRDAVDEAAKELSVKSVVADMRNMDDLVKLAENFTNSGLDVLVNNAGISKPKPITDITLEDFSEAFETNVRAPLFLIKELCAALSMRQGCVVNVSSVIANKGTANASIYSATKGGMNALTKSLAIELAPRNIRVNAVAPGLIETPLFEKRGLSQNEIKRVKKLYQEKIAMNRFGHAEEVAEVITSLIESTYVTGSIWGVDGGFSA